MLCVLAVLQLSAIAMLTRAGLVWLSISILRITLSSLLASLTLTLHSLNVFLLRPASPRHSIHQYPCHVIYKPSISVDGAGIVRCAKPADLSNAVEKLASDVPFQIQSEVHAHKFLNLQYQATDNGVKRIAASEQILDGCTHCGNRYPTDDQPWELYDFSVDRIESNDLSESRPEVVRSLSNAWDKWAAANQVTPLPRDLRVPYLKPDL